MLMQILKKEAMKAISTLPENAGIEDMMYRLYVIEKVRKGKEAVKNGKIVSVDALKREIELW